MKKIRQQWVVRLISIKTKTLSVFASDAREAMLKGIAVVNDKWDEQKTATMTAEPAMEVRRAGLEVEP